MPAISNENLETIVIGDMDHDLDIADAIGARCILYNKGHQYIPDTTECQIIENLRNVIEYI